MGNLGSHALPVHSPVSLEVMAKAMKAMKRVNVIAKKAAAPKAMKAMKRVSIVAKAAAPKAMKAMKGVNTLAKAAAPKAMMRCELENVYSRSSASDPWWLCQLRCVGVSAQSWSVGAHGGKPQSTDSCSSVRPSLN